MNHKSFENDWNSLDSIRALHLLRYFVVHVVNFNVVENGQENNRNSCVDQKE